MRIECVSFILLLFITESSCIIRLFFTWKIRNNILSLTCKVDQLVYDVIIYDANNKEQAACLFPSEDHECFTYLPNAHTYQNLKTNTTTLTIHIDEMDSSLNGNWTCLHGRYEKADTEINVLIASVASSLNTFSLWTLIGYFSSVMVIHSFISIQICHGFDYCSTFCKYLQANKRRSIIVLQWFSFMVIIIYFAALPVFLSVKDISIYPKLFLADGIILGILSYIFIKVCRLNDKNPEVIIVDSEETICLEDTPTAAEHELCNSIQDTYQKPSVESIESSNKKTPSLLTSSTVAVDEALSHKICNKDTLLYGKSALVSNLDMLMTDICIAEPELERINEYHKATGRRGLV